MGVDQGYGAAGDSGVPWDGGAPIKALAACASRPPARMGRLYRARWPPAWAAVQSRFQPDGRGIRQLRRLRGYNCRSGRHGGPAGEGRRALRASPTYLTYLPTTRWIFDHSLRGSVNSDFCPLGGFHWATYQAVSVQRSRCLMVDLVSPSASR